jgi:hypothetical protein
VSVWYQPGELYLGRVKCTVHFCAGEDDALGMMREARKMHAVLLTLKLLRVLALLAVVYLEGVVVTRDNRELSCVIEVE